MLKVWRYRELWQQMEAVKGGKEVRRISILSCIAGNYIYHTLQDRVSTAWNSENTGMWGTQVLGGSKHSAQKRNVKIYDLRHRLELGDEKLKYKFFRWHLGFSTFAIL